MNIISGFRGLTPEGGANHKGKTGSRKAKGQTVVLVAFSMVALIAFVGLAVDGGATCTPNAATPRTLRTQPPWPPHGICSTIFMANNGGDGTAADEQTISSTLSLVWRPHTGFLAAIFMPIT